MIGLYSADTTRLVTTYNGLSFNNPADAADDTFEINSVAPHFVTDTIEDPAVTEDGSEIYGVRKQKLILTIDGTIRAQSIAALYDKKKLLAKTIDPAKLSHENPTTQGFLPLAFSTPTADTANYATGLVSSLYYARVKTYTPPVISEYTGLASFFRIEFEIKDPRRYFATQQTQNGAGTINNSLADYRSWPVITITMSGAGSATYTIQNANTYSTDALVLDLSTMINGSVVSIDMGAHTAKKNGVLTPSIVVSGTWWDVEPLSSNVITITNGTNATTVTTWYRAFCV